MIQYLTSTIPITISITNAITITPWLRRMRSDSSGPVEVPYPSASGRGMGRVDLVDLKGWEGRKRGQRLGSEEGAKREGWEAIVQVTEWGLREQGKRGSATGVE